MNRSHTLVVADVDCCLLCGSGVRCHVGDQPCPPNPDLAARLAWYSRSGIDVVIWSGGGKAYAEHARDRAGLRLRRIKAANKPDYPVTYDTFEEVVAMLGRLPDLQFDDDPSEALVFGDRGRAVFRRTSYNPHGWVLTGKSGQRPEPGVMLGAR